MSVSVYCDFKDGKPLYYVRYAPLETKHFPHGLSLAAHFERREDAEAFAELVRGYVAAEVSALRAEGESQRLFMAAALDVAKSICADIATLKYRMGKLLQALEADAARAAVSPGEGICHPDSKKADD